MKKLSLLFLTILGVLSISGISYLKDKGQIYIVRHEGD